MSLTLPVDFVVTPGSLERELKAATALAAKEAQAAQRATEQAAKSAAAEQAKQLKYVDDLRMRYYAQEQRAREQQQRVEERFGATLESLRQQVAGVTSEEQRLLKVQAEAAQLFERGAISAETYADTLALVKTRTQQSRDKAEQLAASAKAGEQAFGVVGASAAKLAGIMDTLVPGLGGAFRNLNDLADGGEVLATSASAAGASLSTLLAALVPIAIVAGAGYLAVQHFKDAAEQMAQKVEASAASLERMKEGLKGIVALEGSLELRELKVVDPNAAVHLEAATTAAEKFAPQVGEVKDQLGAANEALRASERELSAAQSAMDKLTNSTSQGVLATDAAQAAERERVRALAQARARFDEASAAVSDHRGQVAAYQTQLQSLNEAQGELAGRIIRVTAAEQGAKDATKGAADAAKSLAEQTRVLEQFEARRLAALAKLSAAEKARAATFEHSREALLKIRDTAEQAGATEVERAHLAAQTSREAAVAAANEAQAAASSSDARKAIARDLQETLAAIDAQEVTSVQKAEDAKLKAAQDAAEAAAQAQQQAIEQTLSLAQNGLAGIAELIGGPVAGAVAALVLDLSDTIDSLEEQLLGLPDLLEELPEKLTGLVVSIIDEVIPGLVEAAPDIAEAFALAVTSPEFLEALAKAAIYLAYPFVQVAFWIKVGAQIVRGFWDAFVQGWESFVSGEMLGSFVEAFQAGWDYLFSGDLVADLVDAFREAARAFLDAVKNFFGGGGSSKVGDALKEVFALGQAKTQFGDSPGMIKWGNRGPADFDRDDWVAAARTREQLQRMTGGGGSPGPVVVDLADGHQAFDGQLRRATKQPRTRRELLGFTTARGLA